MKFTLSSLLLIVALTFTLAKKENVKESEIAREVGEPVEKEAVAEPLADGSGAKTEGGSSDFDIEQLLKLLNALKNQDFDEVDKALKDNKDYGFDFNKIDHLPEEKLTDSEKTEDNNSGKKESDSSEKEMEEFEKMDL